MTGAPTVVAPSVVAPSVVVVGDVATDITVACQAEVALGGDTSARIRAGGGGSAANTAAWLAWLGVDTELVAVVGTDPGGAQRVAELVAGGVGCAWVRRTRAAATGTVVVLAGPNERTMLADRGANRLLRRSDVDPAMTSGVTHLHLSGYTLFEAPARAAGRHALAAARRHGATTSVDMASAEPIRAVGPARLLDWIRGVDLLLANLAEARVLAGAAQPGTAGAPDAQTAPAAELAGALACHAANVVVKAGERGAAWAGTAGVVSIPARRVGAVDATGAGDAFAAGLLSAWLTGAGPEAALAEGARLGALAVVRHGARPPSRHAGRS